MVAVYQDVPARFFACLVAGGCSHTWHRRGGIPAIINQWFVGDSTRGERLCGKIAGFVAGVVVTLGYQPALLTAERVLDAEALTASVAVRAEVEGAEAVSEADVV